MFFWKKESQKTDTVSRKWTEMRRGWIQELKNGDCTHLPHLYCLAAEPGNPLLPAAMESIAQQMDALDVNGRLAWDDRFRASTSVEWSIDWSKVDPAAAKPYLHDSRDYLWLLRLGTFHPNGYYREKCLRELAEYRGELGYLVLRTNDWVLPVRELAVQLSMEAVRESGLDRLVEAIPFLEKAKRGARRDLGRILQVEEEMRKRILFFLRRAGKEGAIPDFTGCSLRVRKGIFRLLFQETVLTVEEAEAFLSAEKNESCRNLIICSILRAYPYEEERIERYLKSKSGVVRKRAVECKYEQLKDAWDGLEDMLLDSVRGVREYAAYILQKCRGMDIRMYYRERLGKAEDLAVITALGEYGNREDAQILQPFLESSRESIVRAALTAVSRLMGEEGEEVYWPFLLQEKPGISKAAYQAVCRSRVRYGAERIYRAFLETEYSHGKKYLLKILLTYSDWQSLPYLLRLYNYAKADSCQDGDRDDWIRELLFQKKCENGRGPQGRLELAIRKRSLYAKVGPQLEQEIRGILSDENCRVPETVVQEILFDLKYVTG